MKTRDEIKKSQTGSIEALGTLFVLLLIIGFFVAIFTVRFKGSEERVSGIVYNTKNDRLISGNTTFSVRASEATYVSEENKSSYCLPPHSPYIALVNKAAEDKTVKVVVIAKKYFAFQAPWTCRPNVTVTEQK